jgi:hypothetical protein
MAASTVPVRSEIPVQDVHHMALRPPETAQLAMSLVPEIILQEAAKAAQALRDVIERKPTKCVIIF